MTTPDVQLWHSLLVLTVLVAAVAFRAASALGKQSRDAAAVSGGAAEAAPTPRLAA
jgi:hypothetical protein